MKRLPSIVMVLGLAIILILGVVSPAIADPGSQTWYLSDQHGTWSNPNEWTMHKGTPVGGPGPVVLTGGNQAVWIANESATTDVTFQGGLWQIQLILGGATGSMSIHLGVWDGSTFSSKAGATFAELSGGTKSYLLDSITFTVDQDTWLAFLVSNNTASDIEITMQYFFDRSKIVSPATDPGYPVPELPSVALLSAGLLILGSYLFYKKRKGALAGEHS